ncbi:MAG: MBL fold metallo-hydrolase [Ktedonobacterales bacterium]|nr:MBL fold metallo-hydrolase [Ktedonobacterales bacterium]
MQLRLIRNATMVWDYAGQRILTDPYFAPKFSLPSYSGRSPSPIVELPLTPAQILAGVDLVLLSHLHSDHFDPEAQRLVPTTLPFYCQGVDARTLAEKGFRHVLGVETTLSWPAGTLTRIGGHHGQGSVETMMGTVSGYVLQAPGEPTVYWAGDSVLCDEVRAAIAHYQPDVIITHSGGALWADAAAQPTLIIMDAAQTVEVSQAVPQATVVAIHLESVDHGTVTRAALRAAVAEAGVTDRVRVPEDGETLTLTA